MMMKLNNHNLDLQLQFPMKDIFIFMMKVEYESKYEIKTVHIKKKRIVKYNWFKENYQIIINCMSLVYDSKKRKNWKSMKKKQ
jgi:hypothetical protein